MDPVNPVDRGRRMVCMRHHILRRTLSESPRGERRRVSGRKRKGRGGGFQILDRVPLSSRRHALWSNSQWKRELHSRVRHRLRLPPTGPQDKSSYTHIHIGPNATEAPIVCPADARHMPCPQMARRGCGRSGD